MLARAQLFLHLVFSTIISHVFFNLLVLPLALLALGFTSFFHGLRRCVSYEQRDQFFLLVMFLASLGPSPIFFLLLAWGVYLHREEVGGILCLLGGAPLLPILYLWYDINLFKYMSWRTLVLFATLPTYGDFMPLPLLYKFPFIMSVLFVGWILKLLFEARRAPPANVDDKFSLCCFSVFDTAGIPLMAPNGIVFLVVAITAMYMTDLLRLSPQPHTTGGSSDFALRIVQIILWMLLLRMLMSLLLAWGNAAQNLKHLSVRAMMTAIAETTLGSLSRLLFITPSSTAATLVELCACIGLAWLATLPSRYLGVIPDDFDPRKDVDPLRYLDLVVTLFLLIITAGVQLSSVLRAIFVALQSIKERLSLHRTERPATCTIALRSGHRVHIRTHVPFASHFAAVSYRWDCHCHAGTCPDSDCQLVGSRLLGGSTAGIDPPSWTGQQREKMRDAHDRLPLCRLPEGAWWVDWLNTFGLDGEALGTVIRNSAEIYRAKPKVCIDPLSYPHTPRHTEAVQVALCADDHCEMCVRALKQSFFQSVRNAIGAVPLSFLRLIQFCLHLVLRSGFDTLEIRGICTHPLWHGGLRDLNETVEKVVAHLFSSSTIHRLVRLPDALDVMQPRSSRDPPASGARSRAYPLLAQTTAIAHYVPVTALIVLGAGAPIYLSGAWHSSFWQLILSVFVVVELVRLAVVVVAAAIVALWSSGLRHAPRDAWCRPWLMREGLMADALVGRTSMVACGFAASWLTAFNVELRTRLLDCAICCRPRGLHVRDYVSLLAEETTACYDFRDIICQMDEEQKVEMLVQQLLCNKTVLEPHASRKPPPASWLNKTFQCTQGNNVPAIFSDALMESMCPDLSLLQRISIDRGIGVHVSSEADDQPPTMYFCGPFITLAVNTDTLQCSLLDNTSLTILRRAGIPMAMPLVARDGFRIGCAGRRRPGPVQWRASSLCKVLLLSCVAIACGAALFFCWQLLLRDLPLRAHPDAAHARPYWGWRGYDRPARP